MRREHSLVGGDDGYAATKRGLDGCESDSISPADQLDENIDVGGRGQRCSVVEEEGVAEIDAAVALATRAIGGHSVFAPRPRDERGALPLQKPN